MAAPFLSPATAERIRAIKARAFETKILLADPAVEVTLYRYSTAADGPVAVGPPEQVLVVWSGRQPQDDRVEGTRAQYREGTFVGPAGWNVQPEDSFGLGNRPGTITAVAAGASDRTEATFSVLWGGGA